MSNFNEHFLAGCLTSIGHCLFNNKKNATSFDLNECIAYGFFGGFSGVLPDILEPADNPKHRDLAHSYFASVLLLKIFNDISNNESPENNTGDFKKAMLLAYASHLVLDSQTPAGLPIFTK